MNKWNKRLLGTLVASFFFLFSSAATWACTDFRVIAKDGTVMVARTLEFAMDLQSNLMTSPRGRTVNNIALNGKSGMTWKTKYGYLFLDGLNSGLAMEGMNEQGLSFEALYLPDETQYQTVPAGQEANGIAYLNFGHWLLGNFKSVDEVKAALPTIFVYAQKVPQAKDFIFPLHYSVFDATGKGVVIEFVAGRMVVYDNIGVMTNSPTYDWHVVNLRNYINLSPTNPQPVIANGMTFMATGQGAGMHGLPGDITPPSRFVKMSVMLKTIFTPANAEEALNVAQHIINNVDIPLGFVRSSTDINTASNEYTQWTVFKDLTHKMFYYRTYQDTTLHMVDMSKLNFAENAPQLRMPIASRQSMLDMTPQLQNGVMR